MLIYGLKLFLLFLNLFFPGILHFENMQFFININHTKNKALIFPDIFSPVIIKNLVLVENFGFQKKVNIKLKKHIFFYLKIVFLKF